jgi:hypothetical protein
MEQDLCREKLVTKPFGERHLAEGTDPSDDVVHGVMPLTDGAPE